MAQDGQVDTPPSPDDKKVSEGGTLTAVAEAEAPAAETATPVVAEGSKFAANLEVKRPDLKPGDQMLFDFENEGVGITPVSVSSDLKSDVTAPSLTDTSKGPTVVPAAAANTATAVAEEKAADEGAAVIDKNPDITPIGEPTAEEKAKAKQTNTGPVAQPTANASTEQEAEAEEPIKDVRYRSVFAAKSMGVLNEVWGVGEVSDELKETLGLSGKVKKNDKYGLDFHMPNGHVIEWHANLGGAEFIGMRKRTSKFDEEDARSVAVTAKARGWTAINVHGNQKQKEIMWLHAKMNGLEVANFEPMYSNDPNNVRNRLAAHLAQQNDGEVIGATPVQQQMNLSGGVPEHEQTTREDDGAETPAANVTADAEKPVTEKPVTEKPAENAAVAETAAVNTATTTTPAVETPVTAEAAAAEGGEVKTTFGKIDPPAKGDADGSKIDKELVKSLAEEVRAANPGNPEAEQSLAAVDKALKGKDGVAPAVTDIANEKGVALETKEKPEKGTPAVADTGAKPPKNGGAKPPKRGR
ncbi:MAG: hypothetical protein PSY14_13965 [bacterium]|nr:hypothetical protein [bacterium]